MNPIKDSLKIFLRNIKDPKFKREKLKESGLDTKNEIKKEDENNDKQNEDKCETIFGMKIVKLDSFNIISKKESKEEIFKLIENVKEKELIILELEKLILDIMNYNKVIFYLFIFRN